MISKIYLFFVSTRVAIIRQEKNTTEIAYKKHYYDFLFLNKDTDCASWYSKHHMILNLMKDPLIAFSLVFFRKIPHLQISSCLVIILGFFLAEVTNTPKILKHENRSNMLVNGVYSISMVIFLVQASFDKKFADITKENFIGYPLIVLIGLLNIYNVGTCLVLAYRSIKEICKNRRNKVAPEHPQVQNAKVNNE